MNRFARDLRTPYAQHDAHLAGVTALVLAQEIDRLADRLQRENAAVAALLGDAQPLLPGALRERVAEAVQREPADIRVSTLEARNNELRTLLIDVHAAVEDDPALAARALDERIWVEYREAARRRHVEYPL